MSILGMISRLFGSRESKSSLTTLPADATFQEKSDAAAAWLAKRTAQPPAAPTWAEDHSEIYEDKYSPARWYKPGNIYRDENQS